MKSVKPKTTATAKKPVTPTTIDRTEFTNQLAQRLAIPKSQAKEIVNATLETIVDSLEKNQSLKFVGFGTFDKKVRSPRNGRNPQTGEIIKIPAKTVVTFKAGKILKDAIAK